MHDRNHRGRRTLAPSAAQAIWRAILNAAQDSGFQRSSGTLAETTSINAKFFTWDGTNLGFTLIQEDATPAPTPGDAGAP